MKKELKPEQIELIAIAATNGIDFLHYAFDVIAEKTQMLDHEVMEQYIFQTAQTVIDNIKK